MSALNKQFCRKSRNLRENNMQLFFCVVTWVVELPLLAVQIHFEASNLPNLILYQFEEKKKNVSRCYSGKTNAFKFVTNWTSLALYNSNKFDRKRVCKLILAIKF